MIWQMRVGRNCDLERGSKVVMAKRYKVIAYKIAISNIC